MQVTASRPDAPPPFEGSPQAAEFIGRLDVFLREDLHPLAARHGLTHEEGAPRELLRQVWRRSRELGFYGMTLPQVMGGAGFSAHDHVLIKEFLYASGSPLAPHVLGELSGPPRVGALVRHATPEQMEYGRRNPGKLTYASGGVGTPAHMGAELLLNAAGIEALHVPYKGASDSVNAVLGKQGDFALTIFSVSLPQVEAGRLRALAVTGPRRNPRLPAVPTLEQAGVSGVTLVSFGGLSLPKRTPAPVVERLSGALQTVLARASVREALERIGGAVAPSSGEEYAQRLKEEIALTEKMMKVAKIEAQ